MKYDFDTPIDRRGTASIKWDFSKRFTGLEDLIPLWVADMDFPACFSWKIQNGKRGT